MPKVALTHVRAYSRNNLQKVAGSGHRVGQVSRKKGVDNKKAILRIEPFFVLQFGLYYGQNPSFCKSLRENALTGGSANFGIDPFLNANST